MAILDKEGYGPISLQNKTSYFFAMATHERPDDENRPLDTYICNPKHSANASRCKEFLESFYQFRVWRVQYPKGEKYTCWYVSFKGCKEEPYILNFNISPLSIAIEFRFPQYLPDKIVEELSKNKDWRRTSFRKHPESKIREMLNIYLEKIKNDFDSCRLKYKKWHPRKTKDC